MRLTEDPETEAPYVVGEGTWKPRSDMPDMWKVVHQCENAGFDFYATTTIVHWYIFFKEHDVASLEEFLQKFAEGGERKDFYAFSKYCLGLYRQVHERQLAGGMNPVETNLIKTFMEEAAEMDQLGDEYHEDPKNDHWQTSACIAGPDYRELPRAYEKLRSRYKSFEKFMADYKEFDGYDEKKAVEDQMRQSILHKRRNDTKKKIQTAFSS